jgi:hypothetical protein
MQMTSASPSRREEGLARFLTQLAVDDSLRASFSAHPEAALEAFPDHLSEAAKAAIMKRNSEQLLILLAANQSNSTKTKLTRTGGKKKGATKKTSRKSR